VVRQRILAAAVAVLAGLSLLVAAPADADTVTSTGPAAQWNFDEGTGSTTADASGHGITGTLGSGATWTGTAHSNSEAVNYDGTSNAYVTGSARAVRTDQSFTVAAWVYLTGSLANTRGIASEGGTTNSAFLFKYDNGNTAWMFDMTQSDSTNPTQDRAYVSNSASLNTWTYVVGVYDSNAGTIALYVNGALGATAVHTTTWNATGVLTAGRLRWNGNDQNNFTGSIDDLRVYQRALGGSEISSLYTGTYGNPSVRWDFDEGTGSTTRDESGANNNGALGSGATWSTTAHSGGKSINFDGTTNAYVDGANSVDTTQSYSVSAWAYLSSSAPNTAVIASQAGSSTGAFVLKYENGSGQNSWMFLTTRTESTQSAQQDRIGSGTAIATANTWTHLVGVYDASAGMMYLYVNGSLDSSTTHTTAWNATGNFEVGRLRWGGNEQNDFLGKIDDVRLYPRALSATEVSDLYNDDTPGLSSCLYLTTQPFAFGSTALTGANRTITATAAGPWSLADARGTGAAWSATISSTALTSAAGTVETTPRTIPVTALSITNGTVTAATGADPTTNLTSTGVTLSGSSQSFLSSSGTNRGTYTFTPTFKVAVPANAYRANYSGTVGSSTFNPYTATITITVS